jgi:DNA-binding NarL/FixJ family response regulator
MEDGSGLTLIEKLSRSLSTLPVLVLSMHDESLYAERCLKACARGYIMKAKPPGFSCELILKGENK